MAAATKEQRKAAEHTISKCYFSAAAVRARKTPPSRDSPLTCLVSCAVLVRLAQVYVAMQQEEELSKAHYNLEQDRVRCRNRVMSCSKDEAPEAHTLLAQTLNQVALVRFQEGRVKEALQVPPPLLSSVYSRSGTGGGQLCAHLVWLVHSSGEQGVPS